VEDEDLTNSTLGRTKREENLQKTTKVNCFATNSREKEAGI